MSYPESVDEAESGDCVAAPQTTVMWLARLGAQADRARTWLIRSWCIAGFPVSIALALGTLRLCEPWRASAAGYAGAGAMLTFTFAGILGAWVEERRGFAPRYSRVVARRASTSMLEALNAGVVVVEARVVSGAEEGDLRRPPLVLEDGSGSRLYVPVLEDFEGVRALRGGSLRGPLLGDQTNGALYRTGESVVFVGQVNGQPAEAPEYRDAKSSGVNAFVADLAWLVYKGATRGEVLKALQQRELSRIFIIVGVLLLLCAVVLSMATLVCY